MTDYSDYQQIIAPAADSIDALRACDLERVLMNCYDNFPASLTAFVGWLDSSRPDLRERIDRTIFDLQSEGAWPI